MSSVNYKFFQNNRFSKRAAATIAVASVLISCFALMIWRAQSQANRALDDARQKQPSQRDIAFTKIVRQPLDTKEIQIWQNTKGARDIAIFKNSIFAATGGGLIQFSPDGKFIRHFTVLDGLPDSDLTALAEFQNRLFIGTSAAGLIEFDGENFANYKWRNLEAKAVTALLADGARLLVGTFAGGLLEFDGSRFSEIKPENNRLAAVNLLAKKGETLFVGTFANGLWTNSGEVWRNFTTADGLPSNRIVGAAATGENIVVATDFGVAVARRNELSNQNNQQKFFRTLAVVPTLSSLCEFDGQIILSKDDGELFALEKDQARPDYFALKNLNKPARTANARLLTANNKFWFASAAGIETLSSKSRFGWSFSKFGDAAKQTLTSNTISAVAIDRSGKIWAGTFRGGVDVLSYAGENLRHLETESSREINALVPNADTNEMQAATSKGVARFAGDYQETILNKTHGLPSNSVMHIAALDNQKSAAETVAYNTVTQTYFATARGLAIETKDGLRVLTKVNGLPSDNVYAVLTIKNRVFAGTLNGLAEIENGRVVRTFTDANSKLSHNWITALCLANERIFVGTYGGGVFELTAAGELHAFAPETGKFAVNPNAMWSDGKRLFVGALDGARSLDLKTQKWLHLQNELPAQTVLSVAGDQQNVFFGTTGGICKIGKTYFDTKQNENETN